MRRAFVFLALILAFGAQAFAQGIPLPPPSRTPTPAPVFFGDIRGWFLEPSVMGSLFVTDKGETENLALGETHKADLHTAETLNFIALPGLGLGYEHGRLAALMRVSYYYQLAFFNLPDDQSAEGSVRSLDFEIEIYGRAIQWTTASLEFGGGIGVGTLTGAELEYQDPSGTVQYGRASDKGSYLDSYALTAHLGAAGDITGNNVIRLGWLLRFNYRLYELEGEGTVDNINVEETLRLNVFTALAGLRLRWRPAGRLP